jgi:hypothetical protein
LAFQHLPFGYDSLEEPRLWVKGGKPCDEPGGEKFLAAARFFSPREIFFVAANGEK